jgi:hypothetical protein
MAMLAGGAAGVVVTGVVIAKVASGYTGGGPVPQVLSVSSSLTEVSIGQEFDVMIDVKNAGKGPGLFQVGVQVGDGSPIVEEHGLDEGANVVVTIPVIVTSGSGAIELTGFAIYGTAHSQKRITVTVGEPEPQGCQPFYRMDELGTCVPRQPSDGMNIQNLGIDFTYDFGYIGGKWRVEGFVERTSPDPYPVWILTRWTGPDGIITHDERGGSISGLENPTEMAESIGDILTTNPAVWGQACQAHIYATQDGVPLFYDGVLMPDGRLSRESIVDGRTYQHIATRTFMPTEEEH